MSCTHRGDHQVLRWGLCGALALLLHSAVGWALLTPGTAKEDDGDLSGGFVVELAEVPVMRPDVPLDLAPGPDQIQSAASIESHAEKQAEKTEDPKPDEKPQELPPMPEPEAVLPVATKENKEETKPESQAQNAAPVTQATQSIADQQGPVAMAPVQAAPKAIQSNALPKWKNRLETLVERNKRYPAAAQTRRETGVVKVAFVIDRSGKLLRSHVQETSGYASLDTEALELLGRLGQFPAPPPEVPGDTVEIGLPIRFYLR